MVERFGPIISGFGNRNDHVFVLRKYQGGTDE